MSTINQVDKNFTTRLKAFIDKTMTEAGLWKMVLSAAEDYDEYTAKKEAFFNTFSDRDFVLNYLKLKPNPEECDATPADEKTNS